MFRLSGNGPRTGWMAAPTTNARIAQRLRQASRDGAITGASATAIANDLHVTGKQFFDIALLDRLVDVAPERFTSNGLETMNNELARVVSHFGSGEVYKALDLDVALIDAEIARIFPPSERADKLTDQQRQQQQ